VIGGVLLAALAVGGVLRLTQNDSAGSSDALPSPQDLPRGVVAVVGVPASPQTVTRSDFHRALLQAAASAQVKPAPGPGDPKYPELKEAALGELLDAIWIQGQAEEMGISVTAEEIAAELEKLKKQAFKTGAEYREFLDEAHYSEADVDKRVKTQIVSTAIQRRIQHRAGSSEKKRQRAFADFLKAYNARWRSRTVCANAFVIKRCSNGKQAKAEERDATPGEIPGAAPAP
jgi:hypothetical protein